MTKEEGIKINKNAPLFFDKLKVKKIALSNSRRKNDRVEIDYYRTSKFNTYPYYKPISKIIKIREDEYSQ